VFVSIDQIWGTATGRGGELWERKKAKGVPDLLGGPKGKKEGPKGPDRLVGDKEGCLWMPLPTGAGGAVSKISPENLSVPR